MTQINKNDIPKSVLVRLHQRFINEENNDRKKMGLSKMTYEQENEEISLQFRHIVFFIDDYGNYYYNQLKFGGHYLLNLNCFL